MPALFIIQREFDEAFRYGCEFGLPPKSPKIGGL